MISRLAQLVGKKNILLGPDADAYTHDWTGKYDSNPIAVVRPGNTAEVSAIVQFAAAEGVPLVPVSGNTGLAGGTQANGALMVSLARLNHIREINPAARTAHVQAGVVLSSLHDAADMHDLVFPLIFGARGSAMIGGVLSTNAGGSNVLRYGNTRALCLGLEVVLPSGEIMNLMSQLHKDNTGYNLRDLFIGAEGTLGIITAAVLRLFPKPRAYATALVGLDTLAPALEMLNNLQRDTGGSVEAFEYMPREYMKRLARYRPDLQQPFSKMHEVNILVEVGATSPREAAASPDGSLPVVSRLEDMLGQMLEKHLIQDAFIARSGAQRKTLWAMREAAAEITFTQLPIVDSDIAVPIDKVDDFLSRAKSALLKVDPGAETLTVAHLGDGNLHYAIFPTDDTTASLDALRELVENIVADLGGSFSAEHGIGISKKSTMARRKDPVALSLMRSIKNAVDPQNIMNPGKLLPD